MQTLWMPIIQALLNVLVFSVKYFPLALGRRVQMTGKLEAENGPNAWEQSQVYD